MLLIHCDLRDPLADGFFLLADSVLCDFGGGIRSSGLVSIPCHTSLPSRSPGLMAIPPLSVAPNAPSAVSSRKPALRCLASKPWQGKHLSAKNRANVAIEAERGFAGKGGRRERGPTGCTDKQHPEDSTERSRFFGCGGHDLQV